VDARCSSTSEAPNTSADATRQPSARAAASANIASAISAAARADGWRVASALVFGASLVLLHLASTLYHAADAPATKARLKLLDHCAIYVLIAGTYTPFTLIGLRGDLGWRLFAAIWTLAALGIAFKLASISRAGRMLRLLSTFTYIAMGWLVLVAIRPVAAALDGWTFGWILAGGIAYTLGTVFYHRPSMPHAHAVWHGFVIAGGACHSVAVWAELASGV
jgi:hemolysin III